MTLPWLAPSVLGVIWGHRDCRRSLHAGGLDPGRAHATVDHGHGPAGAADALGPVVAGCGPGGVVAAMTGAPAPGRGRRALGGRRLALVAVVVLAAIGVVLLVLVVFPGWPGPGGVRGSGVAATQTRAAAGFSGLDLAGGSTVTVVAGGEQSVVVHADDNLLGRVTTRVEAGTLVIRSTGSFTTKSPMSVEVSVPSLQVLRLSGSGAISATGITAAALTVTLSGSGVIRARGTAAHLDVTLDGSGRALLNDLVARDVRAVLPGSGLIRVTATRSLDAAVPGSGSITYRGNPPHVATSVTGSGAVTRG